MSFQLSSNVDKNKVFFIQYSELQDRLDPLFYIAVKNIKNNVERKAKYQCANLIQTCSINRGRFGHRPRNDPRFYDGVYPFIQTGDIVKASDSNAQIKYTQTLNELGLKTSKLFQPPKLLFTIAANIGDTAILDYPSCFPDSIVALIPKNSDITLGYLNIYLSLIKSYVVELAPYSAQRNLNNQQLAQVPIVIPPKAIQEEIVAKMDTAYAVKKQKGAEAQRSLDSIDDYLLSELGIDLLEPEENTIQSRIFYRKLSEVSGGRFDSEYYHLSHYQDLENLKKSAFSLKRLVDVCHRIVDGPFGSSIKARDYVKNGIPFIRVADVTNGEGCLRTNDLIFISDEAHRKIIRSRVLPSDVVIAKTGATMGATCIVPESIPEANIRGDLAALTVRDEQCLPEYVVAFINTKIGQRLFWRLDSGGTRGRVVIGNLEKLPIVVPPLNIQKNIVKRVDEIRNQAKQLRQEAEAELEQAKQEVEAMILG